MHTLTQMISADMKPALGVTEPAAIALGAAIARRHMSGNPTKLRTTLNSGMYKNAFTCGVPNSKQTGILISAALGYVAGDPDKGLEVLSDIQSHDYQAAEALVSGGVVEADLSGITSDIYIKTELITDLGSCEVVIRHQHTSVESIRVNGVPVFCAQSSADEKECVQDGKHPIHQFTVKDFLNYIETVPLQELAALNEAYEINLGLFELALSSDSTPFAHKLLQRNGGQRISKDELATAQLLCSAAIEGRVIGLNHPAMSITGSGAHGIICTMPLYACQQVNNYSSELLLRATALSYLITMYIKEYSGRLSAFCGCGIAAGSGMACALAWIKGGKYEELCHVLNNMAASITGMICDGGNHGCVMKGILAVDVAWRAVDFALSGISIEPEHGICATLPEDTMRQIGLIASPGMVETEKTILDIMQDKSRRQQIPH